MMIALTAVRLSSFNERRHSVIYEAFPRDNDCIPLIEADVLVSDSAAFPGNRLAMYQFIT